LSFDVADYSFCLSPEPFGLAQDKPCRPSPLEPLSDPGLNRIYLTAFLLKSSLSSL
jgi:hypothetical protein